MYWQKLLIWKYLWLAALWKQDIMPLIVKQNLRHYGNLRARRDKQKELTLKFPFIGHDWRLGWCLHAFFGCREEEEKTETSFQGFQGLDLQSLQAKCLQVAVHQWPLQSENVHIFFGLFFLLRQSRGEFTYSLALVFPSSFAFRFGRCHWVPNRFWIWCEGVFCVVYIHWQTTQTLAHTHTHTLTHSQLSTYCYIQSSPTVWFPISPPTKVCLLFFFPPFKHCRVCRALVFHHKKKKYLE